MRPRQQFPFWGQLPLAVLLFGFGALSVAAASPENEVSLRELAERVEQQAEEIRALRRQLDNDVLPPDPAGAPASGAAEQKPEVRRLPVVVEEPDEGKNGSASEHTIRFYTDYDRGFVIRPFDSETHPFELKVNAWIQFRHHGFARDAESWVDNAGVVRPIRNRNAFDVERARLVFSGYTLDQRLTYFLQLDGDTDGSHTVDFFDYWFAWRFNERLQAQLGKRKVPASRQWLLGARDTRLVDRPMANDFFRPDRTVGVFLNGAVGASGRFEAMVGNGYRTSNIPNAATDERFSFAATNYFDPYGDYGRGLVDYDWTCEPLLRIGHSFVYSPQTSDAIGVPLQEADFLRLSDGTQLTSVGALAPGVTVSEYDVYFYGLDAAFKWRGWSANAEFFFRWLEEFQADGGLPVQSLMQRGFYVEGGRYLIEKTLDVNLRYSQVNGLFGDASEYALGFNWFPLETPRLKLSFDVTVLDGSPLDNTTTDIRVGDDGILFRTQFQGEF